MFNFTEIIQAKKVWGVNLIIFLLLFSGCSISQKKVVDNYDWQNEVLLADECGYDGLKCCDSQEQQCKYGQNCCVNPKNDKENYCADNCELGKEKAFCRLADPDCDFGLVCQSDRCLLCGGENQFCCKGLSSCADNLFCHNNKCLTCGQTGHPCCLGEAPCINSEADKDKKVECYAGACRDCGFSGGPACMSEPFCTLGNLKNNNSCFRCGGLNQPCCAVDSETNACNLESNLECIVGFCGRK